MLLSLLSGHFFLALLQLLLKLGNLLQQVLLLPLPFCLDVLYCCFDAALLHVDLLLQLLDGELRSDSLGLSLSFSQLASNRFKIS